MKKMIDFKTEERTLKLAIKNACIRLLVKNANTTALGLKPVVEVAVKGGFFTVSGVEIGNSCNDIYLVWANGGTHNLLLCSVEEMIKVYTQVYKSSKQKVYIDPKENKISTCLRDFFHIGDEVYVHDGSGMMDENGEHVSGSYFVKESKRELLTITDINKPFPTDLLSSLKDVLTYINNCEIQGADGKKYYCSKINIVRYSNSI